MMDLVKLNMKFVMEIDSAVMEESLRVVEQWHDLIRD